MANTAVYDLTVNYLKEPCGVDETPRFSYKVSAGKSGEKQISRRVRVFKDEDKAEKIWDSGTINTAEQLFIEYEGKALEPLTKYVFSVEVTVSSGDVAYAESSFVTGKLGGKWAAKWITQRSVNREADAYAAQYLRKTFDVCGDVSYAYLAICGLGYFESYINGKKTGTDVLSPAFTRYDEEVTYMTYDVKALLKNGKNAIGVTLGNGWYNCFAEDPWNTRAATWKHVPKLLCELHITYSDGRKEVVRSEPGWKASKGPITFNGIRNGEFYDARLELGDWTLPEYDDGSWEGTKVMKSPGGILKAMNLEPIRVRAVLPAKKMWKVENGYAFDIGQNQAGVGHFKVRGKAGSEIRFRYSDVLREDGELDFSAIGCFIRSGEFQTDKYIKKSDGEEEWNAIFTYHGFQYIEVTGIDYEPELSDVCAYTMFTDVDVIGEFSCSDELFNKVQHMCRWSTVSNLYSIPTDNPHREKNGWTGDTSLSCEQMLINFGTRSILSKWSGDMRTSQRPAGQIPCIVPSTGYGYYGLMGPDWSSAFIVVPYNVYLYNADKKIIRENYEPIKRNCDFMESMTVDYTLNYGTGDWCAPFIGPAISRNMGAYKCPVEVSDTGFFYNAAMTVVRMAEILGCPEDAEYYSELAAKIRAAFREKFFDKSTFTVKGDCQTATAVMLYFGLYEPDEYRPLVDKLISQIEKTDWHLDFGVLGCKFVMEVLGAAGEGNVGHRMLAQRTFPGCQQWIDLGATTLWECWNGGGSHNHHMFSSLSAFMYKYIGGICPDVNAPGFVHTVIRPSIDCGMESAEASHESMLGKVRCSWKNTGSEAAIDITVPFGGTATLYLPERYAGRLLSEGKAVNGRKEGKEFVVELENGEHSFSASFN